MCMLHACSKQISSTDLHEQRTVYLLVYLLTIYVLTSEHTKLA